MNRDSLPVLFRRLLINGILWKASGLCERTTYVEQKESGDIRVSSNFRCNQISITNSSLAVRLADSMLS